MSTQPLISVVMCTYNGLSCIADAVNDIINQTLTDWELVVSDDGSTDGTREWLASISDHSRIRVFFQEKNLGYVRNKNFAITQARGRFITQQDQDDRSHPLRLELQVESLKRTGLEICGCGYRRIGTNGNAIKSHGPVTECVVRELPSEGYPFWFPALMFTRRVYAEIGPFNEYFAGAFGDDYYWTVVANNKFPIICIPSILYSYVDSGPSITSKLNNPRKLIMNMILNVLIEQRRISGTDWLAAGEVEKLKNLELKWLANQLFISEQYQIYAARSIDHGLFDEAIILIWKSFRLTPVRLGLANTILYWIRARLKFRKIKG